MIRLTTRGCAAQVPNSRARRPSRTDCSQRPAILVPITLPKLIAALLTALLLPAQQPPAFRSTSRLVEVSVVALDRNRRPIADLKLEDLAIQDDGKSRPIAFFHFDGAETPEAVQPLPPNIYSNRGEYLPGPPRNITALVLDTLNTAPDHFARVRAEVRKYLTTIPPQTRIGIFLLGARITVLHDFTDDSESLRKRLDKASGELPTGGLLDVDHAISDTTQYLNLLGYDDHQLPPPELVAFLSRTIAFDMQANAKVRANRAFLTLAALDALSRHLQAVPGRKNIVWVGSGISSLTITGTGMGIGGDVSNLETEIRDISRRIAQRGGTLYIVDARGISGNMYTEPGNEPVIASSARGRVFDRQITNEKMSGDTAPAMFAMSSITGGRVFNTTNDMASGLRQSSQDLRGSYSLAFYSPGDADGKWHALKLKSKRPGVDLLYRDGYLDEAPPAHAEAWTDDAWRTVISSPLGSGAIKLNARFLPTKDSGARTLELQIEPAGILFRKDAADMRASLELCIAELTVDGKASFRKDATNLKLDPAKWKSVQESGIPYTRTWTPAPTSTRLRVIVRDTSTAQYGTLDIPL
jgi:VWFA-related protein